MTQTCVTVILAYLPYFNLFALKTLLKHLNGHSLTPNFSKQNSVNCKLSNVIRRRRMKRFCEKASWSCPKMFSYNIMQNKSGLIEVFSSESPDLNMDLRSLDNGLKQMYE